MIKNVENKEGKVPHIFVPNRKYITLGNRVFSNKIAVQKPPPNETTQRVAPSDYLIHRS